MTPNSGDGVNYTRAEGGEDGARGVPEAFKPDWTNYEQGRKDGRAEVLEDEPYAYACPAQCGCLWRENRDGSISLFGPKSQSCNVCEPMPLAKLVPLYRNAAGVGEVPRG